ncbi:MAG: aldo/keto reductase [Actinomycetota bacterium]|jgi:aryl-alcohol dehydrogenase-like predicted oxidoreductase|nr:aldo/keto reductase [Actinomycetota bacterium]
MEYRQLGGSGLRVSALALGTMTFGGRGQFAAVGDVEVDEARRIVDRAIEAGINLIDTADVYSEGRSEEIVGEVLKGRRDEVVLATKARFPVGSGPNDAGLSRGHLMRACEASLRRLRTDYLDLYQVHERDGVTPTEETLEALDTLVAQGKVRYVGCSNFSAWHVMKSLGVSERRGLQRYVSQQIYYSLLDREAEYELVPLSIDEGVGILVWSPLAGGLLSGKYRRGEEPPEGTRRANEWHEPPVYDEDHLFQVIDALVEVASDHDASPARTALSWLVGRPAVTSVIIGARTESQLEDNLKAAELELSPAGRRRLDDASVPRLLYPYWHQKNTASDRLSPGDRSLLDQAR